MKIAILGDSHDQYKNLEKAVAVANDHECELMVHTGDLGAPKNSIAILERFNGHIKMILGNNDHEIFGIMQRSFALENFELVKSSRSGDTLEETIDGIKIFMHHYPRIAEIAAASGEFDLCIHGHTHTYRSEMIGTTQLLNPGALIGDKQTPSMVVYDTTNKEHEHILL